MATLLNETLAPSGTSGILSNVTIRRVVTFGPLAIWPFAPAHVQPAGYDLTLAEDVLLWPAWLPWRNKLTHVAEYIRMPTNMQGELFGRSSVARQFVMVHTVSGPLEPGWEGVITLELVNLSWGFRRYKRGDRVCQVKFSWLDAPADPPYKGRYQGQVGTTPSKFRHATEDVLDAQ